MDTDSFAACGLPEFLAETRTLMKAIQALSYAEARALWKCNDKLAELNYERFRNMDPELSCIQAYDVWQEKKNYGKVSMGVVRTTYLIDEEGVIVKAFGNVKAEQNPAQMLGELEEV